MIYRFDRFELDADRETLSGPDGPVALRDHAVLVLKLLIERAPEVVTRDQILEGVWGHQALSESSIAQVIREIRTALGDSARSPRHIATRYGRGYQFVAEVETVDASRPIRPATPRIGPFSALVAVFVALAAAALYWTGDRSGETEPGEPIALRAIQAGSGESLSEPFAEYLAFVLAQAIGDGRVTVLDDEATPDDVSARVVEISLAALESGDARQLELAIGRPALDDPARRLRFDEASDLVTRGLAEVLATVEEQVDDEIRVGAGLVSRSSYAVETLLRGMAAQFAGDVDRAAELFEAALAEDPAFEFARYELAIAIRRGGDLERALAILEPMAQRLDGDFWTHRVNNAMGIAYWRLDRHEEALAALRRAEAAARAPAMRAAVLTNIGLLERNRGDLERAEASTREAVRLSQEAGVPRLEASARNSLASVLTRLDRIEDALRELGLARELFYDTGNLNGYAAVLSRTARIHSARGERDEAESLLRLALGVREQIGDQDGIADIQLRLARIHRVRGEFEAARALARDALEQATALGADDLVIDGYQALAALALAERRFDQARSYGNEALRLAGLTGRPGDRRAVRHGLLEIDLATSDRPEKIGSGLEDLIGEADAAGDRTVAVRSRLLASSLYRRLERPDDARRALDRAAELLGEHDAALAHEVEAERARLALALGDLEGARRALDALDGINAPPYPSLMLRARLQARQGDLVSAVETASLARASAGDWWRPADDARLEAWRAVPVD